MTFYEIDFPLTSDYGLEGGPGFRTNVHVMDSGQETRVRHHSGARHAYNVAARLKSLADLQEVATFYRRVGGVSGGFRYKDWFDYTSTAEGRLWGDDSPPSVANTDQVIGTGDGSETAFQLVKTYGTSAPTHVRTIYKPVESSVVVALDGVDQPSGWSVDSTTGIVTFSVAPTLAQVVSAGYEYAVPVRWGEEVDESLAAAIESFSSGAIPNLPLLEIIDPGETFEDYPHGGARFKSMTANVTLNLGTGRVWIVNATTSGLKLILPDKTNLDPGNGYWTLVEVGGVNSVAIHDTETDTLQFTLAASGDMEIVLAYDTDGTTKKWYALT